MNKKSFKILSCLLCSALVFGASSVCLDHVSAHDNTSCVGSNCGNNETHVFDVNSLAVAASNARDGSVIVLDRDILLDRTIEFRSSVTLDLNGHSITMKNGADIQVGAKLFSHTEYYTVNHPGYYTTERKVTYISNPDVAVYDAFGRFVCYEAVPDTEVVSYVDVWHDGWTETKSRNVYDYLDNVDVVFEDGDIIGENGCNGGR